MFALEDSKRKLIRIAVLTSIPIVVISMIPILYSFRSVPNLFFVLFFVISLTHILIIWGINILIVSLFRRDVKRYGHSMLRYLVSFAVCMSVSFGFFMLFRSLNIFEMVIDDPEILSKHNDSIIAPLLSGFFTNLFVVLVQELTLLHENKVRVELENAQLRVENTDAFNQQLKQQIHPHFLFNSLSVLKSLIKDSPDIAEDYVIRLSDFLRLSISSNYNNVVKLSDEHRMSLDYLEMQKIRFGDALHFSFDIPETELAAGYVPGFSLQSLLENAIKHNTLTDSTPLNVRVWAGDGWLHVENNAQGKLSEKQSTRSGLVNLSERYRIISGQNIAIDSNDEYFRVSIKILDNENSNSRGRADNR